MSQTLDLKLEEFYPHPVECVWQALTDPAAISQWLMPCDFQPVVGHKFTIHGNATENWRGFTHCEVLTLQAPRLMEWSWKSADIEEPTRVSFALRSLQGGTRLTLRHTGSTTLQDIESVSSGWPQKLRQFYKLFANLEHQEGPRTMSGYNKVVEFDASVSATYAAITRGVVRWWTTGSSDASDLGTVFTTRFGETYNHIKVAELVPDRRVVWDILEHYHANDALNRDDEWAGTRILWNLTEIDGNRTQLDFTHEGLIESMECWEICEAGWNFFLVESLKPYLEKGEGQPFQHEP